jgi:putative phosphoribosyl transferase
MEAVRIPSGGAILHGDLEHAGTGEALVLFVHGSGSGRHSPRNQQVAATLRESGIGTLLFDLLTVAEEAEDRYSGHIRFDIGLLSTRLIDATRWAINQAPKRVAIGYFGASTGAAAALIAAAEMDRVRAVVSRGGRPDLAADALRNVTAPTLFLVGEHDSEVIRLNNAAFAQLHCEKKMVIVPGATHLFEEPGTLDRVGELAAEWFARHLLWTRPASGRSAAQPGTRP